MSTDNLGVLKSLCITNHKCIRMYTQHMSTCPNVFDTDHAMCLFYFLTYNQRTQKRHLPCVHISLLCCRPKQICIVNLAKCVCVVVTAKYLVHK